MHEASLMRDLMKKIDNLASEQQANRVTRVDIWLGALSHMSAEHFREHFAQSSANTIAVDAELDIEVSEDIDDPNAQSLVLKRIEVDT